MLFILILFFSSPVGQDILMICGQYSNVISDMIKNPILHQIANFFFDLFLNHWPTF